MSAKFEVVDKNKVKITVEVAPDVFEAGLKRSFERNKKKFKVKGFRDGKAPRKMVEQIYGIGALYDDAFYYVLPAEYDAAVKELCLSPVDEPKYDITEVDGNSKLVFTAEVYVKPEVILGQYKGIEVKKADASVSDEDVENELKRLAEEDYRLVTVEDRPAQSGDTVDIDFKGFIDGEPFEGGEAENYALELGSGSFIPGFEDQLIGTAAGDEVKVNVTFPDDYHAENLAGKPVVFDVTVHNVKCREIPEINDDFAAEKSNFETLDEYKADLRAKLAEQKEKSAKSAVENEAVEKAALNAELDVPECMIERRIDAQIRRYEQMISQQGIPFEQYLQMTGSTMESIREQIRPGAEKAVKESLVLEAVAKAEGLKASDEQIDARIKEMAVQYGAEPDDFMKQVSDIDRQYIGEDMLIELAVDFLVENAAFVD